jgi:hypothetical protein
MISLDDEQLGILMTLSAPLHPDRRGAFIEAVIAEAAKYGPIGPGLLNRVGRVLQRSYLFASERLPRAPQPSGTRQQARRR